MRECVRARPRGEEVMTATVYQPEYTRRRCKICGDFYISAKGYVEVGLCKGCAESTGWYVSRDRIGTYMVEREPKEDEVDESEEMTNEETDG